MIVKIALIIIGVLLFVFGFLLLSAGSIFSLYSIIAGLGFFIAVIILDLKAKIKARKEQKAIDKKPRSSLGYNLQFIIVGIVFLILATIAIPGWTGPQKPGQSMFWAFIILVCIGIIFIIIGIIRIIIQIVKGGDKHQEKFQ